MDKAFLARRALAALVALALLGALAFLFFRTAGDDFKSEAQALETLRELKELDTRWDAEALRLANDFSTAESATPGADRGTRAQRLLGHASRPPVPAIVAYHLPQLRTGLVEKEQAWGALKAAHLRSREALRGAEGALEALEAAAQAARARTQKVTELPLLVERVRAQVRRPDIESAAETAAAIEAPLASLAPATAALDPALGEATGRAQDTVKAFLAQREAESNAWRAFGYITVGARIERASRELSSTITRSLEERGPWRAYLVAYAAALLVGFLYLASRVVSTQAQLRAANEGLEQRVADRTRDLSRALVQLKESEAQLVQTEKMASLGQMVAGVAHEINTPLAYVKNSISAARDRLPELKGVVTEAERLLAILQSPEPDAADLQGAFDTLAARIGRIQDRHVFQDLDALTNDGLHGIEQIADLVRNLRNFSRLDRSKVASFNVNEGVRAALMIAKPQLRKVDVEMVLGDVPSITCSPSQVNQVILNLVTNAAQAMDKPRGKLAVTTRPASGGVAIEIVDNGRGIPAEALPKIFDPFFTTKEVGKGTGLGLSIAYKIVAQHGGRIDVSSQPGAGTSFVVVLPCHPPAELAQQDSSAEAAA
jgi:two-component system NtrC family sensor kinase